MYFQQFYLTCLSHASYMIGSDGIACVVDPQRDVSIYLDEARAQNLKIAYIIETHLHADFVSGHRELADRTGAQIYLSARAGATFPHVPVHDGDEIRFGRAILRFLETPGHTIESICIAITDLDRGEKPYAVLTGDTLFIGDVGRPDLAPDLTPQQLAAKLYDSLHQKLLPLGDDVEVWPAHGAGSLCGKAMRPERQSTIGKEKALNYALRARSQDEFVRLLTAELPERPAYFARDAQINRTGAPALDQLSPIARLSTAQVLDAQAAGAIVLDTRPSQDFCGAHVPGAINIALSGQFASWAATVIGLDQQVVIVAEDEQHVEESRTRLARVGIENVIGALDGGMASWTGPVADIAQITVEDLSRDSSFQIVDVRRPPEWADGHIAGALLMPLDKISATAGTLDRTRPIAVHCKSGYRSAIAASLIQRAGFENVANVIGGFDAWRACALPESHDAAVHAV
jgi:glyoxylase-like metal-dependent hydrolase (beta-lactamase superfamily II)/rhodanese-related sulfurtransferase